MFFMPIHARCGFGLEGEPRSHKCLHNDMWAKVNGYFTDDCNANKKRKEQALNRIRNILPKG